MGLEERKRLSRLVENEMFPQVQLALAYGSGALLQKGYDQIAGQGLYAGREAPMLDLILAVKDPVSWHRENLERNPHHYTWAARVAGADRIAKVQCRTTAGVYYNTLIPMRNVKARGRLMKYGVVAMRDLQDELLSWRWMYLAGRLHKPVLFSNNISPATKFAKHSYHSRASGDLDVDIEEALQENLVAAIRMALLLLPEKFNQMDFYMTIAGLSYGGDFRMAFGENPDKVRNIVAPNLAKFEKLYRPILEMHPDFAQALSLSYDSNATVLSGDSPAKVVSTTPRVPIDVAVQLTSPWMCTQDIRKNIRKHHLQHLPASIRPSLPQINTAVDLNQASQVVAEKLRRLVARSSVRQSAKGIATAGVVKSSRYVLAKIGKFALGWSRRAMGH